MLDIGGLKLEPQMADKQPEQKRAVIEDLIIKAQNIDGGLLDLNSKLSHMLDRIRISQPMKEDDVKCEGEPVQSFVKMSFVLESIDQQVQELGMKINELEGYI